MAKGFTPSRSAIYGAPERQAAVGVANTALGFLQGLSADQIAAEDMRQESEAGIAMQRTEQSLKTFMAENANDPMSWNKKILDDESKIRAAVMKPVTQPGAKLKVELALNESMAQWKSWIETSSAKQSGINRNSSFEAGRKRYIEEIPKFTPGPDGEEELFSHLSRVHKHFEGGWNNGKLTVDRYGSREAVDLDLREVDRHIIEGFLMQQAAALPRAEGTAVIENANGYAAAVAGLEADDLFGPDDLADLKKRYEGAVNGAEAEAKRERDAIADAYDADVTVMTLSGQFSREDDKGNKVDTRQEIINHPYLSPARKTTLVNQWDDGVAAYAKGKPYSETQKMEAEIAIRSETDPEKKLGLMRQHVPGLGWNAIKPLYEKMNSATGDDSILAKRFTTTISAVRTLRTDIIKNADEYAGDEDARANAIVKLNTKLMRKEINFYRQVDADPTLTYEQKIDLMDKVLIIENEEAGEEIVESWWKRTFGGGPFRAELGHPEEMRIAVVGPKGEKGTIPAGQLDAAIKHGWRKQ